MSSPNQNIVRVMPREPFDKTHTYSLMHLDSLQMAMCNLRGESLKLWLYCNKNQDGYQFELSQKKVQDWGLKKDSYQKAKQKMIELGYLVPINEGSNILMFYENPQLSEKQTIGILSEKPTIGEAKMSEKPTALSEIQTILSEKPQRNNTIVYNSTIKDSTVADSGLPEKETKGWSKVTINGEDFVF